MSKPKYEYVVVDWGTWGIDVQLSTKIVVKDHLNVKNGDACSLQGTDPVTKRPIMFEGEVLGSIEDTTDGKSAVEALAKKLFTPNELQSSSVTGFQCNKAYESRPGLSPSRRSLLESIVLKKKFLAATRSSVRKDLGLVLKKARASKENNKAKCKGQEPRKL
ncbi:uncharacterized protein [Montipora foliosa]|uniref:uncharacterized protein n=1 Tax=Montipora foliosa TaxID=591990 RepID=UPI0035F14229